jgi:hypothetical protein
MTHEQYVASVRKSICDIANEMLDGRTPFLEGSIRLSSLLAEAEIDLHDEDVMAFTLISSETDNLPLGSAREHWSVEALERLQPDFDKATEWAKEVGSSACQSLIRRFS